MISHVITLSYTPAVPAGNYFGNTTTWSAQPHSSTSTISFGTASDSKVPVPSSSRISDPSFRPFMSQTPPGAFPGMKGATYGQTSSPFGASPQAFGSSTQAFGASSTPSFGSSNSPFGGKYLLFMLLH